MNGTQNHLPCNWALGMMLILDNGAASAAATMVETRIGELNADIGTMALDMAFCLAALRRMRRRELAAAKV